MNKQCCHGLRILAAVVILACLAACTGTTSIQQSHPLVLPAGHPDGATVYFIRPDPGFRGVMDKPLSINSEGQEILALAKGEYTLLHLRPGTADLKLNFHTVVGPSNAMTRRSETFPLTLAPGETKYIVFDLVSLGYSAGSTFVPRQVSRDRAVQVASGLSAMGAAVGDPL